jgi:hypothetical protein
VPERIKVGKNFCSRTPVVLATATATTSNSYTLESRKTDRRKLSIFFFPFKEVVFKKGCKLIKRNGTGKDYFINRGGVFLLAVVLPDITVILSAAKNP